MSVFGHRVDCRLIGKQQIIIKKPFNGGFTIHSFFWCDYFTVQSVLLKKNQNGFKHENFYSGL